MPTGVGAVVLFLSKPFKQIDPKYILEESSIYSNGTIFKTDKPRGSHREGELLLLCIVALFQQISDFWLVSSRVL